mmetsp:Transcript_8414/g.31163  ORF Transcript_8414/g.31163 Transcript_8414/m.31163 type:complete len:408 (+) Transcript_8414:27-1250(+)
MPQVIQSRIILLIAAFLYFFLCNQYHVLANAAQITVLSDNEEELNSNVLAEGKMEDSAPVSSSWWDKLVRADLKDSVPLDPPTELLPQTYLAKNEKIEQFQEKYEEFAKNREEKMKKGVMGNDTRVGLVLWHGMGDSGLASGIQNFAHKVEMEMDSYVTTQSVVIGDSDPSDRFYSYFLPIADQIRIVCPMIAQWTAEHNVTEWHAIGLSQGSQFLRAVVQQCGSVRISKLVSIGGQHEGIFGLPFCDAMQQSAHSNLLCRWVRSFLEMGAYVPWIQEKVVQAQYFHDAFDMERYTSGCIWLPKINNQVTVNQTYIQRMSSLDSFILIKFNDDHMVTPRESSHFEFYELGSDQKITPLRESQIYQQDRLGLRVLDKTNRLHLLTSDGEHLRFQWDWFVANVIPLLKA